MRCTRESENEVGLRYPAFMDILVSICTLWEGFLHRLKLRYLGNYWELEAEILTRVRSRCNSFISGKFLSLDIYCNIFYWVSRENSEKSDYLYFVSDREEAYESASSPSTRADITRAVEAGISVSRVASERAAPVNRPAI